MFKELATSIRITIVLGVICCGFYPLIVWAVAQTAFHHQANGSLVRNDKGQIIGSSLIGQSFTKPEYFQPRPSAAGNGYDPTQSSGTNLGPTSDKLINGVHKPKLANGKDDPSDFDGIGDLVREYRATNNLPPNTLVPVDAVTRSASGLDPDISVANADLQAPRVATARHMSVHDVHKLVNEYTAGRSLGILGERGVNVLMLNIALDREHPVT